MKNIFNSENNKWFLQLLHIISNGYLQEFSSIDPHSLYAYSILITGGGLRAPKIENVKPKGTTFFIWKY